MKAFLSRARQFLVHDVWSADIASLTGIKALVKRLLRIGELVVRGFRDDNLTVQASALTFTSLISLVPLLAIALSLLKGLGAGDEFITRIRDNMEEMPVEFQAFIEQMLDIVNRTNFWALGWVAVVVLFLTVVQVLSSIEASFNQVWGIKSSRAFWRRFVNYISLVVVVPVLILVAFAVNASLSSDAVIARLGEWAAAYRALLQALPFLTTTAALFFLFIFVPNTAIHARPALVSAVVTALLWLGWQNVYVSLQIGVAKNNAIYGTFASVPIFLAWLYVSWVIVLLGAELCFALQNHATYDLERMAGRASARARIMLAFSIVLQAGQAFLRGHALFDAAAFAGVHRIPVRLINEIIRLLVRGGLLVEAAGHEACYVLRRPLEDITLKQIVDLVTEDGSGPDRFGFGGDASAVFAAMDCLDRGLDGELAGTTLRQLLEAHPIESKDPS
ncbi:MAG TPA: YhjD/YihY/BrkB family envelope integrity protein [Kiritimatiellia bacterium]|nr:YhjD/YihY/BrkB family envelope integrity protein [Kiritimatiellia bacterium]HMO98070.1 YhjD/YihY/BrkB family envelope integrity protein [Kiritimatiellia bacterium]HMP97712.1 YhjD/YihY/BrkB family envelope integrity protein [Kiritimatiellia bacterium]